MPRTLGLLTRREREIVDVLFELRNRASADEIRSRLTDPPSYSAVRALLARLEQKGCVRHVEEGVRYIYSATTSPASATRAALQRHLRVFFEGSRGRMITALLREGDWTDEELEALREEIEKVKGQRAKGKKQGKG
jgi:predicted transcriptional regulator